MASEPLSEEKAAKIRSDLDVVRNNMTVFSEILTELNPSGGSNPGELDLLQVANNTFINRNSRNCCAIGTNFCTLTFQELYKTCKEMQARVGQLLCTPTTDELTVDMLQINDDMNDLFDRYDRKTASYNLKSGDAPLIDFGGGEDQVVQNMGAMNLQSAKPAAAPADEFDQFVSSRTGNGGKEGKKGYVQCLNLKFLSKCIFPSLFCLFHLFISITATLH